MANGQPPIYTILALILIPAFAAAVYFQVPSVGDLTFYEAFLVAILGVYGITAFIKLRKSVGKKSIFDLFPGVVEDRYLVGFDALFSVAFLFVTSIMPQNNFIAFVTLILGSLGLLRLGAQ